MAEPKRMIGWNVYRPDKRGVYRWVTKVFYVEKWDGGAMVTAEDVKAGLVDHDGYDPNIQVRREWP